MFVIVEKGPDRGATGEIGEQRFTIGRHPSCSLTLTDDQASSRHAAVERATNSDLALIDLGSTNGTFVDGERIAGRVSLRGDEQIKIGRNTLRVSVASDGRTVLGVIPDPAAAAAPAGDDAAPSRPADPAPVAADGTERPPAPSKGTTTGRGRAAAGVGAGAVALIAVVVVVILATAGGAKAHHPKAALAAKAVGLQQLIAQATPSVVRILGKTGGGSGFVIDAKRQLVLTNAHVAVGGFDGDSNNSGLTVQVGNDPATDTPARLIAASPCDDLAVVQLVNPVPGLKALPLGDSSTVHPGDPVITLGFPASAVTTQAPTGQAPTVNSNEGIVSAAQAQVSGDPSGPNYQDVIQHQAPINPGNSGGPLLNRAGQVIGINSLSSNGAQGQFYSIAIDYAKRLLPDLESGHSHSLMGWSLAELSYQDQDLSQELEGYFSAEGFNERNASSLASSTAQFMQDNQMSGVFDTGGDSQDGPGTGDLPGSPADKAGTQGFLIDAINHVPVNSVQDVCDILNSANRGQRLSLDALNIDSPATPVDQYSVLLAEAKKDFGYTLVVKAPGS